MAAVRPHDGEVTLYTRGDSRNWYAGFRLARGGRLQESLKTRNKSVAKERALERHDDLQARHGRVTQTNQPPAIPGRFKVQGLEQRRFYPEAPLLVYNK